MKGIGLACLVAAFVAIAPAQVNADTTHPYLGVMELTGQGTNQFPSGVDSAGNVLVWFDGQKVLKKFSPSGAPVDFTALGSNTLDAKGGFQCETVPADCDRVPELTNGFRTPQFANQRNSIVAVDQSDGPASGFIYVADAFEQRGKVFVFDQTGRYRGEIDESAPFPVNNSGDQIRSISVSPGGSLYVHWAGGTNGSVDKFVPVDGNPMNHRFVGQIRSSNGGDLTQGNMTYVLGDDEYVYNRKNSINAFGLWRKYEQSELFRASGDSQPIDHSPTQCRCGTATAPFEDGGIENETNNGFNWGSIDPNTHDVYLFNQGTRHIEQWSADNKRIGPIFGNPTQIASNAGRTIAFDNSGGPTDGRFYIRTSGSNLAIYGPPVVIPDITDVKANPSHTSAEISAAIGTAEGPPVQTCTVQWSTNFAYNNSTPCEPIAPYTFDTDITASISGLGVEQDYNYRIVTTNANGTNTGRSMKLHTVAVDEARTGEATEVTPTTAILHGELDSEGMDTEYAFEYGIDTNYRSSTPFVAAGDLDGGGAVPPVQIDQLQPARLYHYRLVARNALGTTRAEGRTFTAAAPPTLSGVQAKGVTADSAVLHARINPRASATTYTFEYGTSTEYGSQAPLEPAQIGDGTEPVPVKVDLTGLQAVTYHFRVVASNAWGTTVGPDTTFDFVPPTCPNSEVRQRTGAAYLPDCRAYELVSPTNAGAVQLLPGNTLTTFPYQTNAQLQYWRIPALNNGRASGPSRFAFLGGVGAITGLEPPNSFLDRYVSTRTNDGWVTKYPGTRGSEAQFVSGYDCNDRMNLCLDYDLNDFLKASPVELGPSSPTLWDENGRRLGRLPTNVTLVPGGEFFAGDDQPSPDFSHYAFSSRNIAFAPGGLTKAPGSVYDNDLDESTIQIVSRQPNGDDIGQDGGTPTEALKIPAVSEDGSSVLMSSLEFEGRVNLYMRVDGAITYEVSKGAGVNLIGMTDDGSTVAFSTAESLLPNDTDSGLDIYVWSQETDELVIASQGNGNGDTDSCTSSWTQACNAVPLTTERPDLDDKVAARRGDVYFYSPEQLDPTNPGVANERNLYVYRNGSVKYVTTLDSGTLIDRIQISPDGAHAAFLTSSELTGYDSNGWRQMYMFDVDDGSIRCASCLPSGEPPQILRPALMRPGDSEPPPEAHVLASQSGRFMTDDGRVAFTTSDALVDFDTNGLLDVYEFANGRPQLISTGTSERDRFPGGLLIYVAHYVGLEAVSADGTDIYFSTFDTMVDEDLNGSFIKIYDARTNGGFLPRPPTLPCVAADECRGEESAAPAPSEVGTGTYLGTGGNAKARRSRERAAKRRAAKRRAAKRAKRNRARQRRLAKAARRDR
jgi:hypothetical protein